MTLSASIIIPVFNHIDLTWRCIQHVLMYPPRLGTPTGSGGVDSWRIVLVDDASTDSTPELGKFLIGWGHSYVRRSENGGCHAAWNTGAQYCNDKGILVFINNDICVGPNCLDRLITAAKQTDGYVGARQLTGAWDPAKLLREAYWPAPGKMRPDYFNSCFAIPKRWVTELGGFDEQFRVTLGDIDFLERYWAEGGLTSVLSDAVAFHGVSESRKRTFGIHEDMTRDLADRARYAAKWANHPAVLGRMPKDSPEQMEIARLKEWGVEYARR